MFAIKLAHQLRLVNLIICFELFGYVIPMNISTENFPNSFTVETGNGRVRGKLNETLFDKNLYYSFRGIPYGKALIGELRFKVKQLNFQFKLNETKL